MNDSQTSDFQESLTLDDKLVYIYSENLFKTLINSSQVITRFTFSKYFNMNMLFCERLFYALSHKKKLLKFECFEYLVRILFLQDLNELFLLIFTVLDFDKNSYINRRNAKFLLIHIINKTDDAAFLLEELLDELFIESETLGYDKFMAITEGTNSDVFLIILNYLFTKTKGIYVGYSVIKGCFEEASYYNETLKTRRSNVGKEFNVLYPSKKAEALLSEDFLAIFGPSNYIRQRKGSKPTINLSTIKIFSDLLGELTRASEECDDVPEEIVSVKNSINHTRRLRNSFSISYTPDISGSYSDVGKTRKYSFDRISCSSSDEFSHDMFNETANKIHGTFNKLGEETYYENYLYEERPNSKKLLKYWTVAVNKELYQFKEYSKRNYFGYYSLFNCFSISSKPEKAYFEKVYYSFSIYIDDKVKKFYTDKEADCLSWIEAITKLLDLKDIKDYYEVNDIIFDYKDFALYKVRHLSTNETYTVKIIHKSDNIENIYKELEVFKMCNHPDICRYIEHFEDNEALYIILEDINSLPLPQFLYNNHTKLNPFQKELIISRLSSCVKYLHEIGVIHNNITPDYIVMNKDKVNAYNPKLVDFRNCDIATIKYNIINMNESLYFKSVTSVKDLYSKDFIGLGSVGYYIVSGNLKNFRETTADFSNELSILDGYSRVKNIIQSCLKLLMTLR
jgi:hypothetical protein